MNLRIYKAERVIRGGSYFNNARNCRAAYRNEIQRDERNDNVGFRLAAAHPERMDVRRLTRFSKPAAAGEPVIPGSLVGLVDSKFEVLPGFPVSFLDR